MIRKDLIVAVIATFCLTATLFWVVPTRSQFGEYNPWVDYNEDGKINILDMVAIAISFGASGDATKNVNVMNWPVTNQTTVWFDAAFSTSSSRYNASGFGNMHLTWQVLGLTGVENVTIYLYSWIYDPNSSNSRNFVDQSWFINSANNAGSIGFPVPSEMFSFSFFFPVGSTGYVSLAFYLTYA